MKDTFSVVSMSCRFMTDQVVGIVYPEAASLTREEFHSPGMVSRGCRERFRSADVLQKRATPL